MWLPPTPPIPCVFQAKCAPSRPHQIPCVFSSKMRFGFDLTVCDAADRSRIPYLFSAKTCVAETLPDSMCFFNDKFIYDVVDRAHIPCLFSKKMRLAGILPPSLGSLSLCVSQVICVVRSEVIVNSHVMRPTAPWFLIFPKENAPRRRHSPG